MMEVDQVQEKSVAVNMGEVKISQAEDLRLTAIRARCIVSNVFKRHGELTERLSRILLQEADRDSDKTVFERLQREFEGALTSQTQEIYLDGEQWTDGLLATLRELVHLEAERKAMQLQGDSSAMDIAPYEKITYKAGNKMICCLGGARIGIQFQTSFAGEPCEVFHCVLESKSFLEKMSVVEHTIPFCLPVHEAENDYLSTNAMKFIDHVGDLLQAYVDRKEQIRLVKELYGNQMLELYFSLQYHLVEFVLADFDCKVVVSLRYDDLTATLPSGVCVLAWPMHQSKKLRTVSSLGNNMENGAARNQSAPARLVHPEDAFRSMSLPEAFADVVLNMPQALQEAFPDTRFFLPKRNWIKAILST